MRVFSLLFLSFILLNFDTSDHVEPKNIDQNYLDYKQDTLVINNHFKGGQAAFFKALGTTLKSPRTTKDLCSQALVLMDCTVYPDTTEISYLRNYGFDYALEINRAFHRIHEQWYDIPEKGVSFKFSIAFILKVNNNYQVNEDSAIFQCMVYYNINDLYYWTDNLYTGCLFTTNDSILRKVKYFEANDQLDSAQFYKEELLRRDPLNKFNLLGE